MEGSWNVSLFFNEAEPPSATQMVLAINDNTLSGSFYGSPFDAAPIRSTDIGEFIIAGATSDGSGEYIHTARYNCSNDRFEGQTWSRGRDFLMRWTAERSDG